MANLANLLNGELERLSHGDIANLVAALPDETERIDLKREWPSNKDLSHDVCAFANGLGGAIVIGYDDPSRGKTPFMGVDGSPRKIDAAFAAVHSLTHPAVHCDMRSYTDSGHVAVAIAIPPTKNGPHEYIGGNNTNLPVRRGRNNKTLSLSEIFALRRAAEERSFEPPDIGTPIIPLDTQDPSYWGVEFTPLEWPEERFVFSYDEDVAFQVFWEKRFAPISFSPRANGIELTQGNSPMRFGVAVHVDGSVVMVWRTTYRPWMYFSLLLENAYCFTSLVFYKLGLAPRALARVRWAVNDAEQDKESPFSSFGELTKRVDFARDAIDDVLTFFVEQADRLAARTRPRSEILHSIQDARKGSQPRDDPRTEWNP